MAHTLNMGVVAEGVENHDQYDALVELGCDYVQGYLVSEPIPGDELVQWVEAYQASGKTYIVTP